MRDELDKLLCDKYPKIFAERNEPPHKTAMCWGFECGDGWFAPIEKLCNRIQEHIDFHNCEQVVAEQVKEKYGGLCFYYRGGCDAIGKFIDDAENECNCTCENCGTTYIVNQCKSGSGWIRTLCVDCIKK